MGLTTFGILTLIFGVLILIFRKFFRYLTAIYMIILSVMSMA